MAIEPGRARPRHWIQRAAPDHQILANRARIATLLVAAAVVGSCSNAPGAIEPTATPSTETPGPIHGQPGSSLAVSPTNPSVGVSGSLEFATATGERVAWSVDEWPVATDESPAFPVKVATSGRYLVDQYDRPWRVKADAAWLMSTNATPHEVDQYLDTRRAQGFNSFYLMAMVHPSGYGASALMAPDNDDGKPPFAKAGDFATAGASPASEAYWKWIDSIVTKAAAQGLTVMLAYTYLGNGGGDEGWYQDVLAQPDTQALFDWGQWLGRRYKDHPNIIWFALGDYQPPQGSEGSRRARAIIDGIKAAGARQLFMAEPSNPDGRPAESADFGDALDMNSFYGYGPGGKGAVYETAAGAWRASPPKPAWMQEGTYEYENNTGAFSSQPWDTRRGRYWSVLGGGTAGDGFGSRDVWRWIDVPASFSTPGAAYSTYAFSLFDGLPWWELEPAGATSGDDPPPLITEGGGTRGGDDFVTAAVTRARDWLLAYLPPTSPRTRSISIDLSALSAPIRARWFDPTTGRFTLITSGYDLANSGTYAFTSPDVSHADETNDWILVLDVGTSPHCGSVDQAGRYIAPSEVTTGVVCAITATSIQDPTDFVSVPIKLS